MSYRYPVAALALSVILVGCPRAPDDTSGDDTSNDDTSGDDTADTDTGDSDTGTQAFDCHVLPSSLPEWAGDIIPPSLVTNTPYSTTATGLADLVDAVAALPSNLTTTPDALPSSITVTDAYVLTTGFKPQAATNEVNFWVADQNDAIYVRLATAASVVVAAGDKVTFTATKGQNYGGTLQVAEINTFSVTSSGNDVYVKESNGTTVAAADAFFVHHLYGELIDDGAIGTTDCLGTTSTCFQFRHGGASGPITVIRVRNDNLEPKLVKGDCIEVYMPAGVFANTATPVKFDVTDFDWFRWYGNSGN